MERTTSTKEKSDDDEYRDDAKTAVRKVPMAKSPLKTADGKSERNVEKRDASLKRPQALVKVKSEQQLIPTIAARRDELKRGYSCSSIGDLSEDSTSGTFKILRSEAESGEGGETISLEAVNFGSASSRDSGLGAEKRSELPLSTVAEISRFLAQTDLNEGGSAAIALESLANEFSALLIKQHAGDTAAAMRRAKLAARLTKLLADSKRYLNPDKFPSDLIFSTQQSPVCNSRLLRHTLPQDTYNFIAPLLGMPFWYPKRPVIKIRKPRVIKEEVVELKEIVPIELSLVVRTPGEMFQIVRFVRERINFKHN